MRLPSALLTAIKSASFPMALLHGFLDRRSLRRKQRYYTKISAAYSRSNVKSRLRFSSKGILNLILNRKKFFGRGNGALDKQKTAVLPRYSIHQQDRSKVIMIHHTSGCSLGIMSWQRGNDGVGLPPTQTLRSPSREGMPQDRRKRRPLLAYLAHVPQQRRTQREMRGPFPRLPPE